MNKKTIAFWLIYAAILIFLYILSATDLIIKENEAGVYSISVILDGISGENLENMKKGMDEAAYEYNVDLSFPAVADNITMGEKSEIAEDAIEAGAKAIIIGNSRKNEIAQDIRKHHSDIPVLLVGDVDDEKGKPGISLNYGDIVKLLSKNISSGEGVNNEVCIIMEDFPDEDEDKLAAELMTKLESMGYKISLIKGVGPKLEKQLKFFDKNRTIFVSVDKESTKGLIEYTGDNNIQSGIYAVGATDYLLGKLEDGKITGMVAWNEYDMGYYMVEKLVKILTGMNKADEEKIKVFYITSEDLKNENYIKQLYPIGG